MFHPPPPMFHPPPPLPEHFPDDPKDGYKVTDSAKILVRNNLVQILEKEGNEKLQRSSVLELVGRLQCAINSRNNGCIDEGKISSEEIESPSFISFQRYVHPIVQNGPSCGLAALTMAANALLNKTSPLDPNFVLNEAKKLQFTKQGEMFSADNLRSLACHLVNCDGVVIGDNSDLVSTASLIRDAILDGKAVLVPYDRDLNNEPCLKNGRKAHWVFLTGLVFVTSNKILEQLPDDSSLLPDEDMPNLVHVLPRENTDKSRCGFLNDVPIECLHVYAVQGKSIRPQLWRIVDLLASNSQLTQLDAQIEAKIDEFVVPADGVASGLCHKIVILSKTGYS